jgi:hypothetical protein
MHTSSLDILERSQLSSPQAKAILQVMELEMSAQNESLATKGDLLAAAADLKAEMKGDVYGLRAELKADMSRLELKIESSRVDTLRWMMTLTGVILGAFYFFLNYARK